MIKMRTDLATYQEFSERVKSLLDDSARAKAYNATGVDGPNELFDFIGRVAGDGHALGEIIYKVIRFKAKENTEDIEKIAAWAFLVWRKHQNEHRGRVRTGSRKRVSKTGSSRRSSSKNGTRKPTATCRPYRKDTRRTTQAPRGFSRGTI
jgi:hypothetical protein